MSKPIDRIIATTFDSIDEIEFEELSQKDLTEEDLTEEDFTEVGLTEEDLNEIAPEIEAIRSPLWGGITDRDTGLGRTLHRLQDSIAADDISATGGDINTNQYLAQVAGEEAVGGSSPTPDQNVVEDLANAAGIEISDKTTLHVLETLKQRDAHRWELNVESCEDYEEHKY